MPYLLFAGERVSPVTNLNDYWQDNWGHRFDVLRDLSTGHKQDPKYAPRRGVSSVDLEALPSLLPIPLWLCNDEIRDLIEKFEPNRHVFLPYEIQREGNYSETVVYNLINFCDPIPRLDVKNISSDVLKNANRISADGYDVFTINTLPILYRGKKLYLDGNDKTERHVWNDVYTQDYSSLFISDEFHDELVDLYNKEYLCVIETFQIGRGTRLLNKFLKGS